MPNYKSDLIVKQEAAALAQSGGVREGDDIAGTLLYATAVVTLLTSTVGDTVQLVDLPAGAVVVPQLSHVSGAIGAGTLALDIGDAGDTDRFADGVSLGSGNNGHVSFSNSTPQAVAVTTPYRLTAPLRLYATVATATSVPASLKLAVTVAYRVKG